MTENRLNKKQKEAYRKMLLEIKEKIVHDIKNMTGGQTPESKEFVEDLSGGHGLHMADFATDMYDREFNLGLASNDRELLRKVDKALKKIEEDTYGLCVECHQPIAEVRLEAIPYVETCLQCQEKLEQQKNPAR
ncbi:MAG TPA: TraR/DksA C4-type zinc finger protein [Candidatus Omnitrophota bacterium]|nr:TraR/DksA C4-type zinc finger protein [Candidatus Omnitrophota bacterium]HPB67490.1 TraR/DksA C4-type zinc finger protein [Candidatus Omnitrophota bacterium]HQO57121.1 TraR/DksA C4-type zinc finger protein [Candidatus Omnitrophota bacterium]HQP12644.1 TraR/DksA C4-type zinc finger protein [Candidatus Omnitrophota bacterium]